MRDWTTRTLRIGIALSVALLAAASFASPAAAQFRGEDVVYPGDLPKEPPPPPPIGPGDFACYDNSAEYQMVWEAGYRGRLVLHAPLPPDFLATGFVHVADTVWPLSYQAFANPQDFIDGEQGPGYLGSDSTLGHRIVFWVDFNDTPDTLRDDQRFDGYLMTVTKDAMAGVTWANAVPHGFYATDRKCITIE
jgi:hypothetical protein